MELKKITLQLVTELLNDAHGKTRIGPGCDKKKYFERENQLLNFDDILKCRVHKDKPRYIYVCSLVVALEYSRVLANFCSTVFTSDHLCIESKQCTLNTWVV